MGTSGQRGKPGSQSPPDQVPGLVQEKGGHSATHTQSLSGGSQQLSRRAVRPGEHAPPGPQAVKPMHNSSMKQNGSPLNRSPHIHSPIRDAPPAGVEDPSTGEPSSPTTTKHNPTRHMLFPPKSRDPRSEARKRRQKKYSVTGGPGPFGLGGHDSLPSNTYWSGTTRACHNILSHPRCTPGHPSAIQYS